MRGVWMFWCRELYANETLPYVYCSDCSVCPIIATMSWVGKRKSDRTEGSARIIEGNEYSEF